MGKTTINEGLWYESIEDVRYYGMSNNNEVDRNCWILQQLMFDRKFLEMLTMCAICVNVHKYIYISI